MLGTIRKVRGNINAFINNFYGDKATPNYTQSIRIKAAARIVLEAMMPIFQGMKSSQ